MESNDTRVSNSSYLMYAFKCLVGAAVCYGLYRAFPDYPFHWSIVSVLLVLDPDEEESVKLAFARMKANAAGGAVSVLSLLVFGAVSLPALLLAIAITLGICRVLRLKKTTRTALAALVIVMMTGHPSWYTGFYRMLCVIAGCLVGIAVTAAEAGILRITHRRGGA